jgi:RNA polymerase sigma-70 factor (sigma-E family)
MLLDRQDAEFSVFVQGYQTELLRSACLLTAGDTHRAEDLVQIAFSRLFVAWPRLPRTRAAASAYVRRILVNAHIDETRRPGWRRELSVPEVPDLVDPTRSDTWLPGVEGTDGSMVWSALTALPPRMRAVIVLRHWFGFSVEESADLLGCTTGTVKSQSAKALVRLRELLEATANGRKGRT